MSFPAYPEYKESGAPWLAQVPAHWELSRIGARFTERRQKVSDADYPPLSVTKNGIVPQLETAAKTDDNDNRKCVLAGDFVINSRSDRKGSSGLSSLDGSVSLINTVIEPDATMHGLFVHHLFRSVAFQEEYYRYGKGIVADLWSTNYGEMKAITLAVPPMEEQQSIAAFLERETVKIDALVAEQERLIALLKEKRQAVISHAVTKGLDPDAPTTDSGVEWLGEIPAHWEVKRLKHVTQSYCDGPFGSGLKSDHYVDEGARVIRLQNIKAGYFEDGDKAFIDADYFNAELRRHEVQAGDVLIAGLGDERNLVGRACVAPSGIEPALVKADCFCFRLSGQAVPQYLAAQMSSSAAFEAGSKSSGSTRSRIPASKMAQRLIALPPVEEQRSIVAALDDRLLLIDQILAESDSVIGLLKERRAALISAAVTGKIDVRGLVEQSEMEAA